MRRPLAIVLFVMAALACALAAAASGPDEPLPTDPALVTGQLPNGLRYIVRPHRNPENRISIWLHVDSGSLNETETTRGLAHFLEHAAFNGSTNFPPGSVVPFFQSLGLSFGRDQNAFTSFDQTVYQLTVPGGARETLDKAVLFMSDVATRLNLGTTEIENERHVVLEEKRARASARQRVQDFVYERLAPESTLGRRLPIGAEETIKTITPTDFRDYYSRWYVPSNMTVIVVGDTDPAVVVELITRHFGSGPTVSRPAPRDAGVQPTAASRAIVATDSELTRDEVSIVRVEPPRGPRTTVVAKRAELVETVGTWILNRRMGADLAAGRVSFLDGDASIGEWGGAVRMISAQASGKPGTWRTMLAELGTAVQRARLHGFTEREVDDARRAFLARADEALQRETTRPAREVLRDLNGAVTRREPPLSATQWLELLRRVLPGITAREVSDAFAAAFDPSRTLFIAELPSTDSVPTEAELLALGRAAVAVAPDKLAETARPTVLLATLPTGAAVVETRHDAPSAVTSAWLDNGVRVHHRFMDERKNDVSVAITLAGGQIEETTPTRGLTEAALRAWERPASSTLSSTDVRDLMVGVKARVRGGMGGDSISLTLMGTPGDLERGLQLAYLMLTDPVIEPAALDQWKEAEIQRIAARKTRPMEALAITSVETIYARDVRPRPLGADEVKAITRDAAQAWLRRLLTQSPVEVAVVGDVDRDTALKLVARYLGALPARPRIDDKTLAAARSIARPTGPIAVQEQIEARTPQAAVLAGFFGADLRDLRDTRLLYVAARVLSTRMLKTIREEKGLVYAIGAALQPGVEYPGFGLFASSAPTDPAKAAALAAAIEEMYTAFAKDGPTADELTVAQKQMVNLVDELMKNPEFWLGRLSTMDYRGLQLANILDSAAQYRSFTAEQVREAFSRYDKPEARFRFVVTPKS